MDRKLNKYLEDILLAIQEIDFFFEKRPQRYDIYLSDVCLRRAIERNITVIGEAMNNVLKISKDISISSARRIVDTRNYVIHGYDSITNEIMWGIVIRHLPKLKEEVENLLKGDN